MENKSETNNNQDSTESFIENIKNIIEKCNFLGNIEINRKNIKIENVNKKRRIFY
jgi:hypothetical protein